MHRTLWALEPLAASPPTDANITSTITDPQAALSPWLVRHLRDQPVMTVLLQRSGEQRAYVALDGCASCVAERCEPGCRVELLRRQARASGSGVYLRNVPHGLARYPITAAVVCWPISTQARVLNGTLLQAGGWEASQLILVWSPGLRGTVRVMALVAVQGDGHELASLVAQWGWSSMRLPRAMLPLIARPMPIVPRGLGWWTRQAPWFLLPTTAEPSQAEPSVAGPMRLVPVPAAASAPIHDLTLHTDPNTEPSSGAATSPTLMQDVVHDDLAAMLHGQTLFPPPVGTQPLTDAPPPAATGTFVAQNSSVQTPPQAQVPSPPLRAELMVQPGLVNARTTERPPAHGAPTTQVCWPSGPGRMTPEKLAHVFTLLQSHPEITRAERQGEPGLSKGRLKKIDSEAGTHAETLLVWFEQAGILEAPKCADSPWSDARPLRVEPEAWYAQQLGLTPIPDETTARMLLQGGAS